MKDEVEKAPHPEIVGFPDDVDPEQATWLNRFEARQMSMDVTLTVDGFLVSGTPQSRAEFYRALGRGFEIGMSRALVLGDDGARRVNMSEVGERTRDTMENIAAEYDVPKIGKDFTDDEEREKAEVLKEEILNAPRRHVLLKDVVILTPSGEYINSEYWRGRLSHVSGWYFGRPPNMRYEDGDA